MGMAALVVHKAVEVEQRASEEEGNVAEVLSEDSAPLLFEVAQILRSPIYSHRRHLLNKKSIIRLTRIAVIKGIVIYEARNCLRCLGPVSWVTSSQGIELCVPSKESSIHNKGANDPIVYRKVMVNWLQSSEVSCANSRFVLGHMEYSHFLSSKVPN